MSNILKPGEYGLINGHVFYDVDQTNCVNNTDLPPAVIEKRLFDSTEVTFISQGEVTIGPKIYELYTDTIKYRETNHGIDFVIEISKGIVHILEVTEVNDG